MLFAKTTQNVLISFKWVHMKARALPSLICGIDWSGAKDAGRRIWIAKGTHTNARFIVKELLRGQDLPNSSRSRDACLTALREWIRSMGASVLGFDFPFGIPKVLMAPEDWRDFVVQFADRFSAPESFANWCRSSARGKELKRTTDQIARTPFSVYNLRMFRQTYWGIAGVLGPLVAEDCVSVLPMQQPIGSQPWLMETCPASLLKRFSLYVPYKGKGIHYRHERKAITAALVRGHLLEVSNKIANVIADDPGGDALDAVIAGVATTSAVTHRDFPRIAWRDEYAVEACVY